MIKKFEAFDIEERFINFVKEAFVDFIDEDIFNIRTDGHLISISIKLPFFYDDFSLANISKIIDINKEQTELIEEAKVAVLRLKDEFAVEPSMYIKVEKDDEEDEEIPIIKLSLSITYSKKDLSIK
jgi:hypothetical protein